MPPETLTLAILRAREHWHELTGDRGPYSDTAAAAILALALALRAETAAALRAETD